MITEEYQEKLDELHTKIKVLMMAVQDLEDANQREAMNYLAKDLNQEVMSLCEMSEEFRKRYKLTEREGLENDL